MDYKGDISIDDLQIFDGSCDTGKTGNSTGYGKNFSLESFYSCESVLA